MILKLLFNSEFWHNKFEKRKTFQKDISKELMTVAWYPTRCWNWCMSEDEKNEIDPVFADEVAK